MLMRELRHRRQQDTASECSIVQMTLQMPITTSDGGKWSIVIAFMRKIAGGSFHI
jgi:hypothetical protein